MRKPLPIPDAYPFFKIMRIKILIAEKIEIQVIICPAVRFENKIYGRKGWMNYGHDSTDSYNNRCN